MMQTVQLALADAAYSAAVQAALSRSCAWHVQPVDLPDPNSRCVLVLDEAALARLPLPLSAPERIVLVTHKNPQILAEAWNAGIVSVISADDPIDTALLAIMAAGLRVGHSHPPPNSSEFSPTENSDSAPISPANSSFGQKRCKSQ